MRPEVTPICPDCGDELYRAMWENEHGLVESEVRCGGCDTPRTAAFDTVFVDDQATPESDSDRGARSRSHPMRADD